MVPRSFFIMRSGACRRNAFYFSTFLQGFHGNFVKRGDVGAFGRAGGKNFGKNDENQEMIRKKL